MKRSSSQWWLLPQTFVALLLVSFVASVCLAKEDASPKGKTESKKKDDKEDKLPKPEELDLTTKDGLRLKATYYPSKKGKEAVPILILHDQEEQRNEFSELAVGLQERGHAVIVPDLRGHGESTEFRAQPGTQPLTISAKRMSKNDYARVVNYDMEELRKFLRKQNDLGMLNLNKLCLVGSGMGAMMAAAWAANDWSTLPLAGIKRGQDARALVFITPPSNFKGISLSKPMSHPALQSKVSILIVVGASNKKSHREASLLHKMLQRHHPEPWKEEIEKDKTLNDDQRKKALREATQEHQDLFFYPVTTSLQGTKLLTNSKVKLGQTLATFIQWRLVDQEFEWLER